MSMTTNFAKMIRIKSILSKKIMINKKQTQKLRILTRIQMKVKILLVQQHQMEIISLVFQERIHKKVHKNYQNQ